MLKTVHVFAPAKINLGLKVLPKQSDGFHGIESIFQAVDLKDELIVQSFNDFGSCSVFCNSLILPECNTLTLAYSAFCEVLGCKVNSVKIELIKKIPSGGGLGGGSSDAAALIRALQKINNVTLTQEQLDFVASKVGCDVFFFFHCDESGFGSAIVSGRGEIVKEITYRSDLHILLVFPNISSSTKEAYALVDEWFNKGDVIEYPALNEMERMYNSSVELWKFKNTFTLPLTVRYPEIGNALDCVRRSGALYSEMSGSGSTVFGLYSSCEDVVKAKNLMDFEGYRCTIVH